MTKSIYTVASNRPLTHAATAPVYEMTLLGDTSALYAPGQFINIAIDGFFLRRPISVCDYQDGKTVVIYKVVGEGTAALSQMTEGGKLDVLCGLGNGFDTSLSGQNPVLIGGGVGTPPMYNLAKTLIARGKTPTVILGFNTADEVFYKAEFEALCPTVITTVDGSLGLKGFVTDALGWGEYSHYLTCGPMPMLKAVYNHFSGVGIAGQLSFEERMGCGFGACMGCSCKTKYGYKRICTEGPVLLSNEVVW